METSTQLVIDAPANAPSSQKITPCLWFDSNALEAAELYTSIFKNSRITHVSRYTEAVAEAAHQEVGKVLVVIFELEGQKFMALNGGPVFSFTEAVSFMVDCDDQAELDRINAALMGEKGSQQPCGWIKDQFGLSWQIVPRRFSEMMEQGTPEQTERVMAELMQMTKIDLATLEKAYEG